MIKLPVKDTSGNQQGEYDIPEDLLVFDRGSQAVHDVIVASRGKARSGSASTKTRSEVRGSGSKPWRQKGLGRARSGSRQNPIWRGGGVAFGPKPRSYAKRVPKKVAQLAFRRAFSEMVAAGNVDVLEGFQIEEPRTKLFTGVMDKVGAKGLTLLVVDRIDNNLKLASRNVSGIEVKAVNQVSTYDLLRYSKVVIVKGGMTEFERRLGAEKGGDEQ